jgi:hypothetical protein
MTMLLQDSEKILFSSVQASLSEIGNTDILVGIPCYNNHNTIHRVVQTVSQGLAQHYPEHRAVLVVVDGHSIDGTRECAKIFPSSPQQTEIITLEQGVPGKGSALRSVFAAAVELDAQACLCVDADLRSITPDWVRHMLAPLLEHHYDYVAPLYARYKYDGTITNNLVYCLTRALYGKRIRQPIGGDFAFTGWLARHYLEQPVWDTDVARFGIDIWMTLQAVVAGARICQTNLGVKLHDAKDPASALGPMFQQVCGTLFCQIEQDVPFWSTVKDSEPIPTFGPETMQTPETINIDHLRLVQGFQQGFQATVPLYRQMFSDPVYQALDQASHAPPDDLHIPQRLWARLLYELVATFHHLDKPRAALIPNITPLYLGQVASFVNQTRDLDFWDAEAVIESLAETFEQEKPHLLNRWNSKL